MTTSRFGVVLDALVTTLEAGTATTVYDGPPVTGSLPKTFVIVGGNGSDESQDAGSITQEWASLGREAKNETGDITVAAFSADGDTDLKGNRDQALVLLGELEDAIRADPTLGGAVQAGWLNTSSATVNQQQNSQGSSVRITFTVSYRARI